MENKIRIASGVKKIEVNDEGEFISLPVADDNFVVRFYRLMDGIGERAQGDRERNSGRYYWKDRGGGKGRRGGEGNKAGSGRAFWGMAPVERYLAISFQAWTCLWSFLDHCFRSLRSTSRTE